MSMEKGANHTQICKLNYKRTFCACSIFRNSGCQPLIDIIIKSADADLIASLFEIL